MSEERVQLSDIAFNAIINAQMQLNNSQQQAQLAQEELNKVLALVLDGLGLPMDTQINIDPQTKELVYLLREPTPTAPIIEELNKAASKVAQPKKKTKRSRKPVKPE